MNTQKENKRLKKILEKVSHDYIRQRDSKNPPIIAGNCFTCDLWCEGGNFQAGHFEPDATGGLLLRYHPINMHGQGGYCCNINRHGQQRVANEYTVRMIKLYGIKKIEKLRALKNKKTSTGMPMRETPQFYETLIKLYKKGDEKKIIKFIEKYDA